MTNPPERMQSRVRLDHFDSSDFDRGASRLVEAAWLLCKAAFFLTSIPWPVRIKKRILVLFGATIGEGFVLRPRVNIHFPWRLQVGDHCWIGERCEILNLAQFSMESHSALAHDVYVAAAGHDIASASMAYKNLPISIESGAWVGTRTYLGPGVHVGRDAVVAAGAVVVRDVPASAVVAGVPAAVISIRAIPPAP